MLSPRMARLIALVFAFLLLLTAFLVQRRHREVLQYRDNNVTNLISADVLARFNAIETRERQMDDTIWSKERDAEQCGAVFDTLWDQLNRASNKFEILATFPIGELTTGRYA